MSDQKFKEFVDQGVAAANNYFHTGRYANALEILSAVKQVDPNNDIVELLIQKICCEQFNIKSPDLNYYFGEHWLGQSLENKSIEIFCDQGMGDTINLLRYVKQLKKEYPNCKIVLNYYAFFNQFERLMQNQPYIDLFTPFHTKCDYHTNIMSLPCILNGIQLDIYYPVHFDKILNLPPPPQISFEEFESLNLNGKNKIGLVWQTNIDNPLSKQKSINVELFDVFKDLDFEFYCLQPQTDIPDWIDCLPIEDLHDTARFIMQCDFVISVDTVVLHLAGVLGKKTFGLIPLDHDPRWGKDSDNIWYPSVELFRQNNDYDWSIALKQIKDKIKILKDKK